MLDDSRVNELCVNQPGEVFVERAGEWQRHEIPEFTFRHCQSLATAIATLTGQHTNEQNPLLSAALSTGERVQIVQTQRDAGRPDRRVHPQALDAGAPAGGLCGPGPVRSGPGDPP